MKKRDLQVEIEKYEYENAEARKQKDRFTQEELTLRNQIDALSRHITLLQNQNGELGEELQALVERDELIRQRLNRRDRVLELKERNEHQLTRSKHVLERSRSPSKYS